MTVRNSTLFIAGVTALLLSAGGLSAHSLFAVSSAALSVAQKASLVRTLKLTDLCLFTEASYTRHLSMTDMNTPFQDSPLVFEHFPSGALVAVPGHLAAAGATRITLKSHGSKH